jgi:hypothetical protein
MLTTRYEAARALAVGHSTRGHLVIGLKVVYRWGLPAWMQHVQNAPLHPDPVTGSPAATFTTSTTGADTAATILNVAGMLLAFSKESNQCMPRLN